MVDMGVSNIRSVAEAFRRVGAEVEVTSSSEQAAEAEALVLPGVGAFGDGMASLREQGLVDPIRRHVANGKPLLGICLGMQLLADESEEHGRSEGLGLVPGRVRRLAPTAPGLRVPNIGWCDVRFRDGREDCLYFAHSFHLECRDEQDVAGTIEYGGPVVAAVERGRVLGLQFHPEKSQDAGLEVLARFLSIA